MAAYRGWGRKPGLPLYVVGCRRSAAPAPPDTLVIGPLWLGQSPHAVKFVEQLCTQTLACGKNFSKVYTFPQLPRGLPAVILPATGPRGTSTHQLPMPTPTPNTQLELPLDLIQAGPRDTASALPASTPADLSQAARGPTSPNSKRRYNPSEADAQQVRDLVAAGLSQQEIADLLGINTMALHRHYKYELNTGKTATIAKIAGNLIQAACSGHFQSQAFYLRTQAGWTENATLNIRGSGPNGEIQVNHHHEVAKRLREIFPEELAGITIDGECAAAEGTPTAAAHSPPEDFTEEDYYTTMQPFINQQAPQSGEASKGASAPVASQQRKKEKFAVPPLAPFLKD